MVSKKFLEEICKANKTTIVKERLNSDYYFDRRVITRNTEVTDGVYLSEDYNKEAIVVDSSRELRNSYQVAKWLAGLNGTINEESILDAVHFLVECTFRERDLEMIDETIKGRGIQAGQKVSLGVYVLDMMGCCKHSALFVTYLLEQFKKEGYIEGVPRVNRNSVEVLDGAHAWCRYISEKGEEIIMDPLNLDRPMEIEQALRFWPYYLPSND
ncbi:MAG: hypothetical protein U9Q69_05550 [Nanoarchaeota archaeon]|nr:hypothetical protein [Nanoarchaeota archaeon]